MKANKTNQIKETDGPGGIRTLGLCLARAALYQLSYGPLKSTNFKTEKFISLTLKDLISLILQKWFNLKVKP
jgi:hypothetical protein